MSASTTTSTVSSAPIISSPSIPTISSSSTITSTTFSAPIIPSSSITVISSSPSSIPVLPSSPSPIPSFSSSSISSSTTPTPPARHTASQTLSPTHISVEASSLLQSATPITIPPPTGTSIALLTQLQEALDFTSTLLGLFFVSLLTLLLIYWSTLYILRKTVGIAPRDTSPLNQLQNKPKTKTRTRTKSPTEPRNPQIQVPLPPKKEVGFAPHPSDTEFVLSGQKAKEIKRRLSTIPQSSISPTFSLSSPSPYTLFPDSQPWPKDGVHFVDLESAPNSEKEKVEQMAEATDFKGLGETLGKKKEDELAETNLEFQRGVRDVSGDTDAIERRGGRRGGRSYGAL